MEAQFPTVAALADCDPDGFISKNKTPFKGVGTASLMQFHARAKLLKSPDPKPYLKAPVAIPVQSRELFFDIEDGFHARFLLSAWLCSPREWG